MNYRSGDKITITHNGKTVPGWIELASDNQISLYVRYDYMKHECMIAGHIGGIPLMRDDSGEYRCLLNDEPIKIARAQ